MAYQDEGTTPAQIPSYWPRPSMHISGSAMPTGVHLSDGSVRTSSNWELVLTGMGILGLGGLSAAFSYVIIWALGYAEHVPTVPMLLGILVQVPANLAAWQIGIDMILFTVFLIVLRVSPLAGYHAAEHMTVTCIERFGYVDVDRVREMPRAHARCGTSLLTGVLPVVFVAIPLMGALPPELGWPLTVLVLITGWRLRYRTGWFIQQYFTTKPPTERQLAAGIRSGQRLLARAERVAGVPTSPGHRFWQRGIAQMVLGVVIGMWILRLIFAHLHIWLDPGL